MKLGAYWIWFAINGQFPFAIFSLGLHLHRGLTWTGLWVLCGPVAGEEEDREACGV